MLRLAVASRHQYETAAARFGRVDALISFRDPDQPPVVHRGEQLGHLDLVCHDVAADMPGLPAPAAEHARRIVELLNSLPLVGNSDIRLLIQCEAGVGRSQAAAAAILRWTGQDGWREVIKHGTYNRRLYRLLCAELGLDAPPEPLVALAVRIKYPSDRAAAFLLSMHRQRHANWRVVFVTDGPDAPGPGLLLSSEFMRDRVEVIRTPERRGRWGHPYRQLGIDRCLELGAAYVGLSNDDNYYTPGYLEQMVAALADSGAGLAVCQMVHSYSGWQAIPASPVAGCADVGNWLAHAGVICGVKWEGDDFLADGRFVARLAGAAGQTVLVNRPLMVKN